jgi:hypothetical protein
MYSYIYIHMHIFTYLPQFLLPLLLGGELGRLVAHLVVQNPLLHLLQHPQLNLTGIRHGLITQHLCGFNR